MSGEKEQTIVQLSLMNDTGDSCYRMRWPARGLSEKRPSWRVINLDAQAKERFEWAERADLLVIFQSNDYDLVPIIDRRKAAGKKTLIEYNDNFYSPPAASPVAGDWRSPILWQTYETFIQAGDGLIVTGPGLEELFSKQKPKAIHVLENHLPDEIPDFDSVFSPPEDEIVLAWGGSVGHISDFLWVLPTIKELLAEYPQLKFQAMGTDAIPGLVDLPEDRFQYTPWGSMQQYFDFWKNVHIGIAPQLETPYNRCRSDIKAVEMSSMGVCPILSAMLPYETFLKKTDVASFSSLGELKGILSMCIRRPEIIKEKAKRSYEYVLAERQESKRDERVELYETHMEKIDSSYDWPIPPGYHEIVGTPYPEALHSRELEQAQKLVEAKQAEQALSVVAKCIERNPYNPHIVISQLKCQRLAQATNIPEQLAAAIEKFPKDIRFTLLKLTWTEEWSKKVETWNQVIEKLESAPGAFLDFFENDIIKIAIRDLKKNSDSYQLLSNLEQLFPENAPLRYHLASSGEQSGDQQAAARHYQWLVAKHRSARSNHQFLSSIQLNYLEAWAEAIEGRVNKN